MARWKKIILFILLAIFVLAAGTIITFFALRAQGENQLKTKVEAPTQGQEAEPSDDGIYTLYNNQKYRYREDVINILCVGVDKESAMPEERERSGGTLGLADAIFVCSIDTKANTMRLIAIPRETMTDVRVVDASGKEGDKMNMQLCYQYSFGTTLEQSDELMTSAVSELMYNVPIQRHCVINFQAIRELNDAIGGVDVKVLEDMTWYKKEFRLGADLHLEGDLALEYVQKRDINVAGSSITRLERQKQYIKAYINKVKSQVSSNPTIAISLYNELQDNMSTDLTVQDVAYLAPELTGVSVNDDLIQVIQGEIVQGPVYEEFHVDQDALKALVIESFYEPVPEK